MLQTLQDYEASVQTFASTCQPISQLGIQVNRLVHTFNEQEDQKSMTQRQHEQVWEVATYIVRDTTLSCWKHGANSVVLRLISSMRNTKNLTQELVAPHNELTQCVVKVELFSLTKSFIDVELVDILGVGIFNWVVDPYFVQLVNKLKTTPIKNGLVVEYKCLRHKKHKNYSKYLIICYGKI